MLAFRDSNVSSGSTSHLTENLSGAFRRFLDDISTCFLDQHPFCALWRSRNLTFFSQTIRRERTKAKVTPSVFNANLPLPDLARVRGPNIILALSTKGPVIQLYLSMVIHRVEPGELEVRGWECSFGASSTWL